MADRFADAGQVMPAMTQRVVLDDELRGDRRAETPRASHPRDSQNKAPGNEDQRDGITPPTLRRRYVDNPTYLVYTSIHHEAH